MVYTATSIALASVEVFVNINVYAEPTDLVCVPGELPDDPSCPTLEESQLPSTWRENMESTRALGMEWFRSRRSMALRVPSAAVIGEWNVLLNPEHPEFARLRIASSQPFRFDARMFGR